MRNEWRKERTRSRRVGIRKSRVRHCRGSREKKDTVSRRREPHEAGTRRERG